MVPLILAIASTHLGLFTAFLVIGLVIGVFGHIYHSTWLIILGILYFGRFEDYSNQETQLAAQGARWAATDNNPSTTLTLQNYVQAQASPELQAGSSDVTTPAKVWIYYPTGSSNAVGNPVRVCVAATVKYPFFSGSSTIVEYATMRIEQLQTASEWSTSDNPTGMPSGCLTS